MLKAGDLCMYCPGDPFRTIDLRMGPSGLTEPFESATITQKDILIYLETYLTKPNRNGNSYSWHKVIHGELVGWMTGHLEPVDADG